MIVKAVKIRADVFPHADQHGTEADRETLAGIAKFIEAVEAAAKEHLPRSRTLLKIKENRDTERRF